MKTKNEHTYSSLNKHQRKLVKEIFRQERKTHDLLDFYVSPEAKHSLGEYACRRNIKSIITSM